jgi:hypothetical protein
LKVLHVSIVSILSILAKPATFHLLADCPGTAASRLAHSLSANVLVFESPDDIIRLAQFDAFIRHTLGRRSSLA